MPPRTTAFDLQGHRGAWGLSPRNTLETFAIALQIGVSTLELDIGVTQDGHVVVSHDRHVSPRLYRDTRPAILDDPLYPYAGRHIVDLTLAQLKTLENRRRTKRGRHAGDPSCSPSIPTLSEVLELSQLLGAESVRYNIEAKVDPRYPSQSLEPACFVDRLAEATSGLTSSCTISAFDWRILRLAIRAMPGYDLAALVSSSTLRAGGANPWTAGIDLRRRPFKGDVAAAALSIGANVLCVNWRCLTDALITSAHRLGLRVVAWTVNRTSTMERLIDCGVDGIVTDFPDRLRRVMAGRGMALPPNVPTLSSLGDPAALSSPGRFGGLLRLG